MEIDRKYKIAATNPCSGSHHDETDSMLFLAKDRAVPAMLHAYRAECARLGANPAHLESITLLIGMAAKAANIPIRFTPEGVPFHAEMQGNPGFRCWVAWNPLADDGDALRLAVELNISVFPPCGGDGDGDFAVASIDDGDTWIQEWVKGGDKMAATRRAIVRAAAEIGKAKFQPLTPEACEGQR